jgi:hypothetical protein
MRELVRRKSLGILALVVAGMALLWLVSPTAPASPRLSEPIQQVEDPEPNPQEPDTLPPSGGPYVSPPQIRDAALRETTRHHIADPRIDHVLALRYAEAVRWARSGSSTLVHPDREVYLVSVLGGIEVPASEGGVVPYARTYYVFDATNGTLVQWGATDMPEPTEDVSARER